MLLEKRVSSLKQEKIMANRYELTEPAREDLKEIWSYLAEFSQNSADKTLKDLAKKFELLAENPKLGRTHDKFIINLRSFPYNKYLIFYFPIENGVELYRIFHSARNIESVFEDFFEGLKP